MGGPSKLRVLKRVEITGRCPVPGAKAGGESSREHVAERLSASPEGVSATRDEAYEEGWRLGYKSGYEEGKELAWSEMRAMVGALETVRRGLENSRSGLLRELEKEISMLALEIAEKLALQELTNNQDAVANLVRRVIDRATEKRSLRVRLSPADYRVLQERRKELMANMVDVGRLDLVEDGTLGRGDCVVETASGMIIGKEVEDA